jgi:hypothetical protein
VADENEIRNVIAEEQSRGSRRRKLDAEERRKRAQTRRDLAAVLASGDEAALMKILRASGLKDGTPEFEKAVQAFRALRGGQP